MDRTSSNFSKQKKISLVHLSEKYSHVPHNNVSVNNRPCITIVAHIRLDCSVTPYIAILVYVIIQRSCGFNAWYHVNQMGLGTAVILIPGRWRLEDV